MFYGVDEIGPADLWPLNQLLDQLSHLYLLPSLAQCYKEWKTWKTFSYYENTIERDSIYHETISFITELNNEEEKISSRQQGNFLRIVRWVFPIL